MSEAKKPNKGDSPAAEPEAQEPGAEQGRAAPLFYQSPQPLNSDRHAALAIKKKINYRFAKETNSVPLNAVEFGLSVRHYPIVFTGEDPAMPVAVVGLRKADNLFIEEDGSWLAGDYVPAYVRRFPFIFMSSPSREQFTLCIDEKSDLIAKKGGRPLFKKGEPTELTNEALEFCTAFQAQHDFTKAFAQAVADEGLLTPRSAEVTMTSGEKMTLTGFRIIEENTFNALSDETFLEWRQRGWIHLVYSHLMSLSNWARLVDRAAMRRDDGA